MLSFVELSIDRLGFITQEERPEARRKSIKANLDAFHTQNGQNQSSDCGSYGNCNCECNCSCNKCGKLCCRCTKARGGYLFDKICNIALLLVFSVILGGLYYVDVTSDSEIESEIN